MQVALHPTGKTSISSARDQGIAPKLNHTRDLTLKFLVAVVNTVNTKTHSSKEMAEFSFENAYVKSICYCKQRTERKLTFFRMCRNEAL